MTTTPGLEHERKLEQESVLIVQQPLPEVSDFELRDDHRDHIHVQLRAQGASAADDGLGE